MKKTICFMILVLMASCSSKKADFAALEHVVPGLNCKEIGFDKNSVPYELNGETYSVNLKNELWSKEEIECSDAVRVIRLTSVEMKDIKESKKYTDIQAALLNMFRDSIITYEEADQTINFNNGLKLQKIINTNKGVINRFILSIDNNGNAVDIWKKALNAITGA